MDWYVALGVVAGAITIIGGLVGFLAWLAGRNPQGKLVEEVSRVAHTLERIDGRIADYVDGLPQAPPQIRDRFEEARRLKDEHRYAEAIKRFQSCLQMEITPSQRAALHIQIGNCFLDLSQLGEALGHYRQAETAARGGNDREGLAVALGNTGIIYREKGERDEALSQLERALEIQREIAYRLGEARQLGNVGLVYRDKGEPDRALEWLRQALAIFEQVGAGPEIEKAKENIKAIAGGGE
jgi:tetratricopeptide (TPR) repeat protein